MPPSPYKGRPRRGKSAPAPAVVDSRVVVLGALSAVRQGRNLPDALVEAGNAALAPRDRAFARRLAQHAVRHQRRLEWEMARYLQRPTRDAQILNLLWLGGAQIDMEDVATHAAVNSTVDLAPQRLRGLINAILRRRLREPPPPPGDPAVLHSFPDWLFQAIARDWGAQAPAVVAGLNEDPPLCLRVNRLQISRDEYGAQLLERGLAATALGEDGWVLEQSVALSELPGFEQGQVSVQGASAQMAARLLDMAPDQQVLDACAAPGSKTLHLLELQPGIRCVAVDGDALRLNRVAENLQRLGLSAELHCGDFTGSGPWQRDYDRILLDVPCSGTGVIGRHPDIKSLRRESDIATLQAQQSALLEAAWSQLKAAGKLLYCTCSILDAENDQIVASFLSAHPDAVLETIELPFGQASEYGWRVLPRAPYEGFYYARLAKR